MEMRRWSVDAHFCLGIGVPWESERSAVDACDLGVEEYLEIDL
jgi:hypothetical protein